MPTFARKAREAGMAASAVAEVLRTKLSHETEVLTTSSDLCRGLRVVMLSDTHGHHRKLEVPRGDMLLHAGDFTHYGRESDALDFNAWLGELPHTHKIVVLGNHETNAEWRGRAATLLTNGILLCDEGVEIPANVDGIAPLRVFGTDFFWPNVPNAALQALEPGQADILMVHSPASGFVDDNQGCARLLHNIERIRPSLVVCGHIHSAHGVHEATGSGPSGSTTFVNAANAKRGHGHMGWPAIVMDI